MRPYRLFVCLTVALNAAWPSAVNAQQPAAPGGRETDPHAAGVQAHSCVDPADVLARRRLQSEPCQLPMVPWPVTTDVPGFSERPRWPAYPPPRQPGPNGEHTMFWRFPVQPMGPHDVPRHSRR
jgi:hypothetical protein